MGLAFLHRCQLIHTDLKPENLLLERTPLLVRHPPADPPPQPAPEEEEGSRRDRTLPWASEELRSTFAGSHKLKIVDLGNACWTYKHFTDDVQTRQYRAPEVILGASWSTPIDCWSLACIVFELLTGDLLFEPKSGRSFDKNDDHLAQMAELLGPMPRSLLTARNARNYFTRRGDLRYIKSLKYWPLDQVLRDKYKLPEADAAGVAAFLLPLLALEPARRATADQALAHPWLRDIDIDKFDSCL